MGHEELVIDIEPDGKARLAGPPSVLDVPFAKRRPSRILELALRAPLETRPLLLAEYWHLLLTGTHHDPVYHLAVTLDARGDALSNPPRLLAETLAAAARRVPPESRWRIERDPEASVPEAALSALASLPRDLDFMAGWALVLLEDFFTEAGLLDGARSLTRGLSGRVSAGTPCVRPPAPPLPDTRDHVVRRWSVPCDFGPRRGTARVFIGCPAPGFHPLCFQAAWIREQQGGTIPPEVMDRVQELTAAPELAR